MAYVIPQEQYMVPQEPFVVPQEQVVMEPQYDDEQQVIAVPYGCGSCSKKKFGGRSRDKLVDGFVKAMTDPYKALEDSFAKNRISNPILHGVKIGTVKSRKYGAGKKRRVSRKSRKSARRTYSRVY